MQIYCSLDNPGLQHREQKCGKFVIMSLLRILLLFGSTLACADSARPPDCPLADASARAPSAGCMAVRDDRLLVVEDLQGRIGPPGGSSKEGESAQCTAHRETWEETGLDLQVGELVTVMQTGFYLYDCRFHLQSGDIDPPPRMEVRRAFMLHSDDFDQHQWRFPDQTAVLRERMTLRDDR